MNPCEKSESPRAIVNPLGNESGRQEIDDLPGKSDLGKPEINNDKEIGYIKA